MGAARVGRFVGGVVFVVVLALSAVVVWQRQFLSDWWNAAHFSPSKRVAAVSESLALSSQGERVFYATAPVVSAPTEFAEQCAGVKHVEQSHILGCYRGDHIFLLGVSDSRLAGIVEVTAAHELMHAVWARTPAPERDELGRQLQKAYADRIRNDGVLKKRMKVYAGLAKSDFVDELHSVLATEVQKLPSALEKHYAEWFTHRQKLLGFYEHSYGVFRDIEAKSEKLQKQMRELRTQIETERDTYTKDVADFNAAVDDLLARNNRYEFSDNPGEFAELRNQLQARQEELLQRYNTINAKIEKHNKLRQQLIELQELNNTLQSKLDSEIETTPTLPNPTS